MKRSLNLLREPNKVFLFAYYETEVTYKDFKPVKMNGIANDFIAIPKEEYEKLSKYADENKILLDIYSTHFSTTKVMDNIMDTYKDYQDVEVELLDVYLVKGEEIEEAEGMYYAHEYDKYAQATRNTIEYSNGFKEYLILCLNKDLVVADGLWHEPDNNGSGDTFEPTKIIYKKEKSNV